MMLQYGRLLPFLEWKAFLRWQEVSVGLLTGDSIADTPKFRNGRDSHRVCKHPLEVRCR